MADGASGYATVQHNNGTPYLLTGGNSGSTVEPGNVEELKAYLTADEPCVIRISKHFKGEGEIKINSNKTVIGTNDTAHMEGMMMSIAGVRNIIIQNISFSRVVTMDEMELNGARNIWIDRCEFFTDRDHDKDYYDGLLDIKNESSFITVSWCNFHDHHKSILISSGDDSYQDSVQRITFHHNYFHDCGSRFPSIRFGKAHLFSNFFENNGSAIHTRVWACVKVEHNYFLNSGTAIMQTGQAGLDMDPSSNIFINSTVQTGIPDCKLNVPYPYEELIDSASLLTVPVNGLKPGLFLLHLHVGNQTLYKKIIRE
jgi:pectate lyase